jgi:hypothetical protein
VKTRRSVRGQMALWKAIGRDLARKSEVSEQPKFEPVDLMSEVERDQLVGNMEEGEDQQS